MSALLNSYASSVATLPTVDTRQPNTPYSQYELFKANTGWQQSSEQYQESTAARELLMRQTKFLAEALQTQGIDVYQDNGGMTAIGEVTGKQDELDSYRSICFLPTIAQRERRPVLNALQYFQKNTKLGKYLRMAVITAGERVPVYGPVGDTISKLSRDISRWAHEAEKDYNVAVIYRGIEFTIDDDLTFHIHANVLYAPRKALSPTKWSEFLTWTHQRIGSHWQDSGKLEKPQEAIKYPFKPLDVEKLDAPALAWLFNETKGKKISQPMSDLKKFREGLLFEFEDIDRVDPETGEVTTITVKSKKEFPLKIGTVKTPNGSKLGLIEKMRKKVDPNRTPGGADHLENMIVARCSPQFRFSPYAEPVTLVQNYTADPKTFGGKKRLEIIEARKKDARRMWDANGAPCPETALMTGMGIRAAAKGEARKVRPFNVHTSRSTVQDRRATEPPKPNPRHSGNQKSPLRDNPENDNTMKIVKTAENLVSGNSSVGSL